MIVSSVASGPPKRRDAKGCKGCEAGFAVKRSDTVLREIDDVCMCFSHTDPPSTPSPYHSAHLKACAWNQGPTQEKGPTLMQPSTGVGVP